MLGSPQALRLRGNASRMPRGQLAHVKPQIQDACRLQPSNRLHYHQRRQHQQRIRGITLITRTGLDGFIGLSSLLKPEVAAMFSAALAAGSVGLNYYGNLLTESKRVELQKELDREKQAQQLLTELASIIGRYRGPLLESSIDLEQRLWHLATMTGEWYKAEDVLCGEEIAYTLFTLAQFLGFLEVVRREGPRERSFLAAGNPGGSDTLATLVESFRFVLAASPATLQSWLCVPDDQRDHPGARHRAAYQPMKGKRKAMVAGLGDGPDSVFVPLRVSRGAQRAIGSQMGATPLGSERHYTHSYSQFLAKLKAEPDFACWLQPIEADLAALLTGNSWMGESPAPAHRWCRVLLLQQLLVDTIDLLDPDYVRVPALRRIRLAPVAYAPLPNVEQYTAALTILSGPLDATRFTGNNKQGVEHFQALQNLLHPERVIEAANEMRRATSAATNSSSGSPTSSGSANSSPLSTQGGDDAAPAADPTSSGDGNWPIVPPFQLPSVGATGVQLLQAITGQGRQQERQPQLLSGSELRNQTSREVGGTPVTADRVDAAIKNGTKSGGKKA